MSFVSGTERLPCSLFAVIQSKVSTKSYTWNLLYSTLLQMFHLLQISMVTKYLGGNDKDYKF